MRYNVKGVVTMRFETSVEARNAAEAVSKVDNESVIPVDRLIETLKEHARNLAGNIIPGSGSVDVEVVEKVG